MSGFSRFLLCALMFVQSAFSDVWPHVEDEEMEQKARYILDGIVIDMHSEKVDTIAVNGPIKELEIFDETYKFKIINVVRGEFEEGEVLELTRDIAKPTTVKNVAVEVGDKFRYFSSVPEDPFYEQEKEAGRISYPISRELIRPHLFGKNVQMKSDKDSASSFPAVKPDEQGGKTSEVLRGQKDETQLGQDAAGNPEKYSWVFFLVLGIPIFVSLYLWQWKFKRPTI